MIYISKNYFIGEVSKLPRYPVDSIEFQVEVFYDRIDGWHLEPADRMVNGWCNPDGTDAINTVDKFENRATVVPDAAWASLQCVLSYFEIIGWFNPKENTFKENGDTKRLFECGFGDVFSGYFASEAETNAVCEQVYALRNGLYHKGHNKNTSIAHFEPLRPIHLQKDGSIIVDPHVLIPYLRQHLRNFKHQLLDTTQNTLRERFRKAYNGYYDDHPITNLQ